MKLYIEAPFSSENREFLLSSINGCELCENPKDAEIFVGDLPSGAEFPNLKFLQICFAGAEKYCREGSVPDGVVVANVTGAFGEVISEYILGAVLSVYRKFFGYRDLQKEKKWQDLGSERTIYGERALILGCGNIGSLTAKKLQAFGAEVVGIRKNPHETEFFDEVYGMERLEEQLALADLIICCLPETPLTRNLLNKDRIAAIKQNALLVNVGRGSLIDENALAAAIANGHLAGAVLDVFNEEPLPENSPLWGLPNVFVTPHISGKSFKHSALIERKIAEICVENINRFTEGKTPINLIKKEIGYALN
ncbi:MAG: D-2-hydroxyacid dehydrogenase [Oscillospiraceae bacterium]